MKRLTASITAIALALSMSTTLHAQGQGKGNGNGNKGKPAAAQKANGPGNAAKANRDPAKQPKSERRQANRGAGNANRGNGNAANAPAAKQNRGNGPAKAANRNNGNNGNAGAQAPVLRGERLNTRRGENNVVQGTNLFALTSRQSLIDGCPPGLAKKRNGCLPPGQAKKRYYRPDYFGLSLLGQNRYFYEDGFLLNIGSGGRISGYVPLLGGALSIGNTWPNYYEPVRVPDYYSSYYGLGGPNSYRYANNAFYRVDPETAAITSVAALITGDDFVVGQPVPSGYDVYNVPYGYRDRYYDRPDAYYRYSDGYVYQIDPETRLVAAAIELLI